MSVFGPPFAVACSEFPMRKLIPVFVERGMNVFMFT